MLNNKVNRLRKVLERLEKQRSNAMKYESGFIKRANRASQSMSRTKSISTIKSKEREIQRENDRVQRSKKTQADLLGDYLLVF